MDHFLSDAKRLVQRLQHHDNAVDILIGEATNLQNKLIAMRQYKDEINKMNQGANHRPRSTLILGSQLENQRIQNLEQENRELSISLAEHQSALELIMNKYREQVLVMMKTNGANRSLQLAGSQPSETELKMSEQIAEMAFVMRQSAYIDESVAAKEIETIRSLQVENDNLRQLLQISGQSLSVLHPPSDTQPITNANSPVLEPVCNKDSGIYDEDFSPNFNVFKKGKKRIPLSSRHTTNLESLFKPPEIDVKPENSVLSETDPFSDFETSLDNKPYQIYTVEALVENKTSLETNGDIEKEIGGHVECDNIDSEMPDTLSNQSNVHDSIVNSEFKEMVFQNDKENPQYETNDALQFLDDVLDLAEEDVDAPEKTEPDDLESNGPDDKDYLSSNKGISEDLTEEEALDFLDDLSHDLEIESSVSGNIENLTPNKEDLTKLPEKNELDFLDDLSHDLEIESSVSGDIESLTPNKEDSAELLEANELDFLDDLNRDLEIERAGDVDLTLNSDTESEITVTEDDALAMFDSVLDDEMDDLNDSDDDNDS